MHSESDESQQAGDAEDELSVRDGRHFLSESVDDVEFDINKEIESAKARLLDNQSFVFVESDRNGFGTLFEFKDRYLSVKERLFLE